MMEELRSDTRDDKPIQTGATAGSHFALGLEGKRKAKKWRYESKARAKR